MQIKTKENENNEILDEMHHKLLELVSSYAESKKLSANEILYCLSKHMQVISFSHHECFYQALGVMTDMINFMAHQTYQAVDKDKQELRKRENT